jgi:hypothetical protein
MSGVAWFFLILFILLFVAAMAIQTFFQIFEWSWWPHPLGVFFMPMWMPFSARHHEMFLHRGYAPVGRRSQPAIKYSFGRHR